MPRRNGLALPEVLLGLCGVAGGVAGATLGFAKFGVLGGVVGVPVGFVAGAAAAVVLCIVLAAVVFGAVVAWAFLKGGRGGVRELFRDPPAAPTSAGDCHGDG